jgi:hypothetical protein
MALSFSKTNGSAIKNTQDSYKIKDGENVLRMVGGILPRYMYWIKGTNDKQIPAECLGFDRDQEKFTNKEVDHVPTYHPELKCQWSYSVNCIDPADGKVKVFNLKKKLFAAVCSAAEDLGLDPTDPDTGFDIIFKKVKTGPLAYNVEYTLSQLKLKTRSLTDEERAAVAAAPTIDAKFPRPTPEDIKALLDKLAKGVEDEEAKDAGVDSESVNELG